MIYKGCIFGLNGTLYMKTGFGKRLVLSNLEMYEKIRAMNNLLRPLEGKDFNNGSQYKTYLFEGIAKILNTGHPDKPPINAASIDYWYQHEYNPARIRILEKYYETEPICRDTLRSLTDKYTLALYSDTGIIDEQLRAIGIPPATFAYRISVDKTGQLRPAPKAYTKIAQLMGASPQEVLVVGDSPKIDGETAKCAGMDYFQIGDRNKKAAFTASWKRLADILL